MEANKILEIRHGPHLDEIMLKTALSWLTEDFALSLDQVTEARDFWFDQNENVSYATCKVAVTTAQTPFAISWEAVLALKVIPEGPPSVTATIFLFSNGDRLGRFMHYGSDYLHMTWNEAGWSVPVWLGDEFGEWESITRAPGFASSARELKRVSYRSGEAGTELPEGPFRVSWTLTVISNAGDEGRVVLKILGERVGRLVDQGRSYIVVTHLSGSNWLVKNWRAEDAGTEIFPP